MCAVGGGGTSQLVVWVDTTDDSAQRRAFDTTDRAHSERDTRCERYVIFEIYLISPKIVTSSLLPSALHRRVSPHVMRCKQSAKR